MKSRISIAILLLSITSILWGISRLDETEADLTGYSHLNSFATELTVLWPDKNCGAFVTRYTGYPLVSMACSGDFTSKEREEFLDALFKKGFVLLSQQYKPEYRTGTYLFKTKDTKYHDRHVFFKLFFRDARFLWPDNPKGRKMIAILVNDTSTVKQVIDWEALGVTLSYSVMPFREETGKVHKKLKEYGKEAWVGLSLEPVKLSPYMIKVLTLQKALNPTDLNAWLDEVLQGIDEPFGVSTRMGSLFTKNVFAMRKLLSALKEKKIHRFLDLKATRNSVAAETAAIMGFDTWERDVILDHKSGAKNFRRAWASFLKVIERKGAGIAVVHAGNRSSLLTLKHILKEMDRSGYRFVRISDLNPQKRP